MKPNERVQVEFIVDCLRKGQGRAEIMSKFGQKWESVSRTSFDRRLDKAKELLAGEQEKLQEKVEAKIEREVEKRANRIMSVLERKELLTKIASGEVLVIKPVITRDGIQYLEMPPDHKDRMKAMEELNKMEGDYATKKIDVSVNKPLIIDWGSDTGSDNT